MLKEQAQNNRSKLSNENRESIAIGSAILIASLFMYLLFPALVVFIAPNAADIIWKSPISTSLSIGIFVALIVVGLLLNALNVLLRMRRGHIEGNRLWLTVGLFAIFSISATAFVMILVFGVSSSILLSFGVESAITVTVGLVLAVIAAYSMR